MACRDSKPIRHPCKRPCQESPSPEPPQCLLRPAVPATRHRSRTAALVCGQGASANQRRVHPHQVARRGHQAARFKGGPSLGGPGAGGGTSVRSGICTGPGGVDFPVFRPAMAAWAASCAMACICSRVKVGCCTAGAAAAIACAVVAATVGALARAPAGCAGAGSGACIRATTSSAPTCIYLAAMASVLWPVSAFTRNRLPVLSARRVAPVRRRSCRCRFSIPARLQARYKPFLRAS